MRVGREIERETGARERKRESALQRKRECVAREQGEWDERERERESGEYVRRVRERESLFRDARRKVKHRNGGRKKKKRGLKGDNESEAKGRDCGESVSPSCRHP